MSAVAFGSFDGAALRVTVPVPLRHPAQRKLGLSDERLSRMGVKGLRIFPSMPLASSSTTDVVLVLHDEETATQALGKPKELTEALGGFLFNDGALQDAALMHGCFITFEGVSDFSRLGLLIGVSNYHDQSLRGTLNDVALLKEVLATRYNFPPSQLWCLTSGTSQREPTKANVCALLDSLVRWAVPDDIIVIHYSGHGSYTETATGRQECLVLGGSRQVDGVVGDSDSVISDTYIAGVMQSLAKVTRYATIVLDCCYSAGQTREGRLGTEGPAVRFRNQVKSRPAAATPAPEQSTRRLLPTSEGFVQLCACEAHETAVEMCVDGEHFGCFTYLLCDALRHIPAHYSFADVWSAVCTRVTAHNQRQHPQIGGDIRNQVFGVRRIEPKRCLRVTGVLTDAVKKEGLSGEGQGKLIALGGGAVHCVTRDSLYEVHCSQRKCIGHAEVVAVRTLTCVARFTPVGGAVDVGADMEAVEVWHASDVRLRVHMLHSDEGTVPHEAREAWRVLKAALATPPLCEAPLDSADLAVGIDADRWTVRDPAGNRRFDDVRMGKEAASILIGNLKKFARFTEGLALRNLDTEGKATAKVEIVRIFMSSSTAQSASPSYRPTAVEEGDHLYIEVRNHSAETVYFAVLEFAENYQIECLYPQSGRPAALPASATVQAPLGAVQASRASWLASNSYETTMMLIATRFEQVDYSQFTQDGASRTGASTIPTHAEPRQSALAHFVAHSQRNLGPSDESSLHADWCTISRIVTVRPKCGEQDSHSIKTTPLLPQRPSVSTDELPSLNASLVLARDSPQESYVHVTISHCTMETVKERVATICKRRVADIKRIVYFSETDNSWPALHDSCITEAKLIEVKWK